MSSVKTLPVEPKVTHWNPAPEQLKAWALEMPNARQTDFGAPNVQTEVLARSKGSTYIVTDTPDNHSDQCISTEEGAKWAETQNQYIRDQEMIVIDGYIGNDPEHRTAARLIMEKSNANIAGMQQQLYYPVPADEKESFEPELTVVYTPNLNAEGYPDDRLIAVWLDEGITRVMNSDYFGESKKGGLRMWNKRIYDKGGIPLHAGCKLIPVGDGVKCALIIGLSGTGKTTTTFTKQNESKPVQDDFVALMADGRVVATENGCFAKTFGLDPNFEPAIYNATNRSTSYLENVSMDESGKVDYFDESYTQNGRATFTLEHVAGAGDAREIDHADFILILNRNENVIPGVSRLSEIQAAAYFMLGETKGTAAGGAAEAGKSLRVPGTNPFFPLLHAQQGNRMHELMQKNERIQVFLLNTGRVGGGDDVEGSKKVKIPHSSALVKAIAEGTIEWETHPDFGFEVASKVPGIGEEDQDILQPWKLYETQGRMDEYRQLVDKLKTERLEFLAKWPGLDQAIINAVK